MAGKHKITSQPFATKAYFYVGRQSQRTGVFGKSLTTVPSSFLMLQAFPLPWLVQWLSPPVLDADSMARTWACVCQHGLILFVPPRGRPPSILSLVQTSFSDISMHEDQTSMLKSVDVVHGIIEEQIAKGIPSERIVVGGFSQGGAIALLVLDHPLYPDFCTF